MTYQDFITKTNGNAHVPRADWNACYAPVADWAIGLKKSDLAALGFDFQHGGKSNAESAWFPAHGAT